MYGLAETARVERWGVIYLDGRRVCWEKAERGLGGPGESGSGWSGRRAAWVPAGRS
jgi:hypothetical protein